MNELAAIRELFAEVERIKAHVGLKDPEPVVPEPETDGE